MTTSSIFPRSFGGGEPIDGEHIDADNALAVLLGSAPALAVPSPASAYGWIGWACDPTDCTVSLAVGANAVAHFTKISYPATLPITNVLVYVSGVGNSMSNSLVGLWNAAGTLIGQSADQSAAWQASDAIMAIPLVGGPFTPVSAGANDFLWAGIYIGNTAATRASFIRKNASINTGAAGFVNGGLPAAQSRSGTIAIANTATLPNITPAHIVQDTTLYWAAIS